jgi:hypothetical protein
MLQPGYSTTAESSLGPVCVQVLLRRFIIRNGYETSYTCLARRAAKTNNVWNRLVRRGSITRRICMYGALQLAFTIICCGVFLPTYFSYWLALTFQVRSSAGAVQALWIIALLGCV